MLGRVKGKLAESRYMKELLVKVDGMDKGVKRTVWLLGGIKFHGFRICAACIPTGEEG